MKGKQAKLSIQLISILIILCHTHGYAGYFDLIHPLQKLYFINIRLVMRVEMFSNTKTPENSKH